MSSSVNHWFVQTDFGALLGPMPRDALAEMARTGALLVRDQVREGTDGKWRLASEVPGLFDEQTPSLGLMSSTLEDLFASETSAPRGSTPSRNPVRQTPRKAKESSAAHEAKELEFEIDAPLIAPPKATEPPPITHELEFEVDVPLTAPAAAIIPPPIVEKSHHAQAATPPNPTVASQPEPIRIVDPTPLAASVSLADAAPTPQPSPSWEAPVTAAPRWQPPGARSRSKAPLGKTVWMTAAIASAALLAILTAWWFWPRQRSDIYASYVAIYKELQQQQEGAQDQARWIEFVTRARTQLDETVPWLEERAQPGDREKSLLLYAGRDLQEMLDQPSGAPGPHQKRLNAFFEQLAELYASK